MLWNRVGRVRLCRNRWLLGRGMKMRRMSNRGMCRVRMRRRRMSRMEMRSRSVKIRMRSRTKGSSNNRVKIS